MKNKLLFTLALVVGMCTTSYAQFSFGVSPGININGAYFGYQMGKVMPFISYQSVGVSVNSAMSYTDFDWDLNKPVVYDFSTTFKGSLRVPTIGVRYNFKESDVLRAYGTLSVSKPFLSASATEDGEEIEEVTETVKKISLFGGEAGFGAEYLLNKHFGVSGEFGFRYLRVSYNDSIDDSYYDPNQGEYIDSKTTIDLSGSANPTYSKVSLNFYF